MYREVINVSALKLLIYAFKDVQMELTKDRGNDENVFNYYRTQRVKNLLDKLLKTYKRTIGNGRTRILLSLTDEQCGVVMEFAPLVKQAELQITVNHLIGIIHQNTTNELHRLKQLNFFHHS